MNGQQRAVLWIGLILVGLNLARHWSEISAVIFSGAGITSGITGGGINSGSGGSNPSIQVPIDPLLPIGPKITVPIPNPLKNLV